MYTYENLHHFIKNIFCKIGCSPVDAETVAEVLLSAELRGIESHGMLRISDYYNLWKAKRINATPVITIVHETPSTAVIDGDSGLGMVVGKKAMLLAIEKAKTVGTGWVSVSNSNHFGIAGYFSMMALKEDMIGISMTNANPLVAPTFSTDRLLGTNPIAVAIPAGNQPAYVADFATTPIARGKLDLMHKKNKKAPLGYVQDKDGNPSEDPNILTQGGAILPLGGDYEHGSHKGYCLGSIVDIFSAVLSGAGYGPWVPPSVAYLPVKEKNDVKGTGHFFGAMRIDAFRTATEFKKTMDEWILTFRNAKPAKGQEKVLVPGDIERDNEERRKKEGIPIMPLLVEKVNQIATELGIENIK
ncbi:MAG TPA: Ldh family oxidoreductase [Bacteroidales bacterium]|nr:Ldh family oxidoreductase [Bacteroidales bacterium]HQH19214.1 Ldh family oxidoreductase [Bacteroidales bacterium]HQI46140.1 Ldh family oxidoreductase [Bacteroidales bacterium]